VPIYEYSCTKCGKTVEAMQKMSDPPLKKCPKCGGPLAKMMSSTSFVLKGTGWYATDYAKKSNGSGNGSGNGKRAEHKEHVKDIDAKKDAPAADKGAETKSEKTAEKATEKASEKASEKSTEKAAKDGMEN
jgi:putative FmdB family regulatory protein